MSANLSELFDKDVRPFLDAIDNLRSYGLDEDLHLPTVVVVGDQSSGKSSILEAISGIQLPRGQGMVTRCPLQLQMKKGAKSEKVISTLTFMFEKQIVKWDLPDLSMIGDAVKQAQCHVTGSEGVISETLLTLTVVSPDVPDLTVVDLPGIARMNIGNQDINIYQQIVDLVRKYIAREEAIILAVCPCTADLQTSEALKLANEYDKEFQRTYCVLTKVDLVDKGSEDVVLKIVNNELLSLPKGFLLVKCRGQDALTNGQSLEVSLKQEREFFNRHPVFRKLTKSQWGIPTLSQKLSNDLSNYVKKVFPSIRENISSKLKSLKDQKNKLALAYPATSNSRLLFVSNKVNEFCIVLSFLVEGKYDSMEIIKIEDFIQKKELKADIRIIPHLRRAIDNLETWMLSCTPDKSLDLMTEEIMTKTQGKEPLEFLSYPAFKGIAFIFLEKITKHIKNTLEIIYRNFSLVLDALIQYYFGKYPVLLADLKIIIFSALTSVNENCLNDINLMLKKEKICFILDKTYKEKIDSLTALQNSEYTMKNAWMPYFQRNVAVHTSHDNRKQLPKYIAIYYIMTINRISEQVPLSILLVLMGDYLETLKKTLPAHVLQQEIYDLIKSDCGGIEERKGILDVKIMGLTKAINEIGRINVHSRLDNGVKTEEEDL